MYKQNIGVNNIKLDFKKKQNINVLGNYSNINMKKKTYMNAE